MTALIPTARETAQSAFAALMGSAAGMFPAAWIDGGAADGQGQPITLLDPATGAPIGQYRDAGAGLAGIAGRVAAEAQAAWAALGGAERGRRMQDWASALESEAATFARLESATTGKPIRDCTAELARVADMIRYWAGWTDKIAGRVIPVPTTHLNYTRPEPLGVVVAITPWNAPVFTAGW
ncbi:MAG: aldehyde dehydrogenase family protein, partial [Acetobacteraceae bacterium]|nr:aldehyde dehydrogenase family protein [Acetobacteraceae bacterium]